MLKQCESNIGFGTTSPGQFPSLLISKHLAVVHCKLEPEGSPDGRKGPSCSSWQTLGTQWEFSLELQINPQALNSQPRIHAHAGAEETWQGKVSCVLRGSGKGIQLGFHGVTWRAGNGPSTTTPLSVTAVVLQQTRVLSAAADGLCSLPRSAQGARLGAAGRLSV